MPRGTKVSRCVKKVKRSGRGVNPYAVCQASTGQSYATGKKLRRNKMNEETLLEGLYNSMSDMAHVIAEAFGLVEATRLAKEVMKGNVDPVQARLMGVRTASVTKGGSRGLEKAKIARGVDPEQAKKEAEEAGRAVARARRPEETNGRYTRITRASGREVARGLSGGARGKNFIGKPRSRGGSGLSRPVTKRSIEKGKKIEAENANPKYASKSRGEK